MINRYDRQIKLFGKTGQEKLKKATVAIIGAGGIGSCTAEGLARLGVGKIFIFDSDTISLDNLNRQVLYKEKDIGKKKITCLKNELKKINSEIDIKVFDIKINQNNSKKYLANVDLIADCTDRLKAKLNLNKIAYQLKKPLFYASAIAKDVRFYFINPKNKTRACLNCFLDKKEQLTKKIINSTAHIAANIQINEILKYLIDNKPENKFIIFNLETLSMLKLKANKKINCDICNF